MMMSLFCNRFVSLRRLVVVGGVTKLRFSNNPVVKDVRHQLHTDQRDRSV